MFTYFDGYIRVKETLTEAKSFSKLVSVQGGTESVQQKAIFVKHLLRPTDILICICFFLFITIIPAVITVIITTSGRFRSSDFMP